MLRIGRAALAVMISICAVASAEDWPQWRGPMLTGAGNERGLPATWSETENVAWAVTMPGPSASTPAIRGERVFTSTVETRTNQLLAMCVDARDGRVRWTRPVGPDRKALGGKHNMSSPSPVVDARRAYFLYGNGRFVAFNHDGRRLWSRDLESDYGEFVIKWGFAGSPLLYDNRLYIVVLQNPKPGRYHKSDRAGPLPSFLLAIDPRNGRTLYKHDRPSNATDESTESYITPVPYEANGRKEVVIHGGEYVTGHDAATGAETWRWEFSPHNRKVWQRTVSPATVVGDTIFVPRPKYRPLYALQPLGREQLGDDIIRWRMEDKTPDVTAPLYYDGRVYVLSGDSKTLSCLEPAEGRVVWQERLKATQPFRASPTGADGKVYCVSKAGEVFVVKAGDRFELLAKNAVEGTPCLSTIAVANGAVFIRTKTKLYCIRSR